MSPNQTIVLPASGDFASRDIKAISDLRPWRYLVEEFLQPFRGKHIFFLPNPGNGGDSLIATATYEAFARAGVQFTLAGCDTNVEGQTVFLGGGGNFVPLYNNTRTAFECFIGQASRIVLLPHTVRGHEDLLVRLDASCTLFVRDNMSLEHVKRVNPMLDVRLAHDMAFHLDVVPFLTAEIFQHRGPEFLRLKLREVGLTAETIQSWASADFLRLDGESTMDNPVSDVDLSSLFMLGVNPDEAPLATWCFLRAISLARHANTDRLHVGIGASMLGVSCTLRDNSYGKNAAVFSYSLSQIPGVRLMPESPHETVLVRTRRVEIEALLASQKAGFDEAAAEVIRLKVQLDCRFTEVKSLEKLVVESRREQARLSVICETLLVTHKSAIDASNVEMSRLQEEVELLVNKIGLLEDRAYQSLSERAFLVTRGEILIKANKALREMLAHHDALVGEVASLSAREKRLLDNTHSLNDSINAANVLAVAAIVRHRSDAAALREMTAALNLVVQHKAALLSSNSWRITTPLRLLRRLLRL